MLQIFITNNIRICGASTPLRAAVTKALTYENPAYKKAKRIGKRAWGIDPRLELFIYDQGDIVAPRGFQEELEAILKTQGYDPKKVITIRQTEGNQVNFGWAEGWQLRTYQGPFVDAVLKANGVGIAPAGSGKTIMGLRYISEKGRAALWLTHTTDLMHQTAAKAKKLLPEVGKIGYFGDSKKEWGDGKLIIATVQTLRENPHLIDAMNDFIGTVVIDEAHHFPAIQFVDTAGKFKAANMLGVTATPERKDGLECYMYKGIGPQLHRVQRDDLYTSGELIKPEVKFIYTDFSYETASDRNEINSVEAGGEDMDYTELTRRLINNKDRLGLIAQQIVEEHKKGAIQIVITESVRYCFYLEKEVHRLLMQEARNARTAVVHGGISRYKWQYTNNGNVIETKQDSNGRTKYKVEAYTEQEFTEWQVTPGQRKDIMAACDRKEINILFATQLAREGLDMPHLTVGHMAMPKRGDDGGKNNGGSVEQEIGRIQRKDPLNPDKKATWYDYVDYNVGVFKQQYQSRRSVYKRLGIKLPKKPRTEKDEIEDFLAGGNIFDLPY
ncbi:DEAD/DEAH box helicase [Cytobacillus praedii]|uniref:DEAD/DEAH box helicase n=1 Tax=Cytobacillus praedii TaxID=1742358 RepID=UPI002E231F42|nr:DEAD/DEAH box helicase family protein [Cytobacillus praedii]MED3571927.1 DEAD/DEAH box helicase family protein [Cytobacillus praedii]